jgi:hypothetical protein
MFLSMWNQNSVTYEFYNTKITRPNDEDVYGVMTNKIPPAIV